MGTIGTCWGAYWVLHTSEDPMVTAGVSMHPSNWYYMEFLEEEEAPLYEAVGDEPQYFANTFDVPDTLRPGGIADELIDTVSSPTSH